MVSEVVQPPPVRDRPRRAAGGQAADEGSGGEPGRGQVGGHVGAQLAVAVEFAGAAGAGGGLDVGGEGPVGAG